MKKYLNPNTECVELLCGSICEAASPAGENPYIDGPGPLGAPIRIPSDYEVAK